MVSFNKFFTSVLLAVMYASSTMAAPQPTALKHATHRKRTLPNGVTIESFNPASTYQTFEHGIDHPLSKRDDFDLGKAAASFVTQQLGLKDGEIAHGSVLSGQTAKHAYLKQSYDGVDFANAVANVAFNKDNKVVAFGNSFVKPKSIPSSTPTLSSADAISAAEKATGGKYNNQPTKLEYFAKDDGTAVLTHAVQVDKPDSSLECFIDAHSGELVSIVNYTARDSYLVLPLEKQYPDQGFELLDNPKDISSSPAGWHYTDTQPTTDTSGNNAISYKGDPSSTTPESSPVWNFEYPFDLAADPTEPQVVDASRVNGFYVVNSMHDIAYQYGFTEDAFNFQNDNFGKGGAGSDRVTISVQDANDKNNADFTTPPDGQSGRMRMYLFDVTTPERDGTFENDIVVHEFTHGITNRMTGGGSGRCLQTVESSGLGEGWSDAMAHWTETTSGQIWDYIMGQYVINDPAGIRKYPYSTSAETNPLRYSSVAGEEEEHNIGEVWANMLHNVYASLVDAYGWSNEAKTNPDGREGNVVFLHLFMDALSLQPCNPTFTQARDAWIQADINRYDGENTCLLWNAFASRGLGVRAANFKDDSSVPQGC